MSLTQPKKQPLSEVVPLLVAALVCEAAATDPNTGKKSLIGIFDTVHGNFPATLALHLYFKIADAEGHYEFDIRYVHTETGELLGKAEGGLSSTDRLATHDLFLPFPPLQMPEAGLYEFQIWANSTFLGSASVRAAQPGG